jgi:hypothetical protein
MTSSGSDVQVFTSDNEALQALQAQYGSVDASQVQSRRRQYYSYVNYPLAGQSVFNFFSIPVGQSNRQLTNIQQGGNLDNPFLVKAIRLNFYAPSLKLGTWAGTDVTSVYTDLVNGLFQVGFLKFIIGSKEWLYLPSPFLYAPPAYGRPIVKSAGMTIVQATGLSIFSTPFAYLNERRDSTYLLQPSPLINENQNFRLTIEYPSGLVPILATSIFTAASGANPLYIGIHLDGIEVRPVQ